MGKLKKLVQDEKLFLLIRNFLLTYLPVQRRASENTVTVCRTVLNQFLRFAADKRNIPVTSVTFDLFSYEMITAYLSNLITERIFSRHMEQPAGGIESLHCLCVCLLPGVHRLVLRTFRN